MTNLMPPDQLPIIWDIVKYAVLAVNPWVPGKLISEFCLGLAENLMSENYQTWLVRSDEDHTRVKAVVITRITMDVGNMPHLLIDVAYGYEPTTQEEKTDFLEKIMEFAQNKKCVTATAMIFSSVAANAAKHAGMEEVGKIYSRMLGG